MEAEFGRELDRLSQTESETAAFWQAKHSALHGRFLAADTELRILRDELAARDARDMSLALLAQQQSQQQHRQQQAGVDPATAAGPASGTESLHGNHKHHHHHHAPQPAADNRPSQSPSVAELESRLARFAERENALLASLDEARAQCAAREEEARSLRAQVRGLKEWVSTSTRALGGSDGRTSDEVFGEGMARLGNGLQNWVIMNFRRAKVQGEFGCVELSFRPYSASFVKYRFCDVRDHQECVVIRSRLDRDEQSAASHGAPSRLRSHSHRLGPAWSSDRLLIGFTAPGDDELTCGSHTQTYLNSPKMFSQSSRSLYPCTMSLLTRRKCTCCNQLSRGFS